MALKFDKCRERHAIADFSATLRFAVPVDAAAFARVASVVTEKAAKLELPARLAQPVFAISVGQGSPIMSPSNNIGFQRFSASGDAESRLLADEKSITFSTREYPGWEDALPTLIDVFGDIAKEYLKTAPLIAGVQLQYLNEFTSPDSGLVSAAEVFRAGNRWVAPLYADSPDLWHSHIGQFIPEQGSRKLVNVNIDVIYATAPNRPDEFTAIRLLFLTAHNFDVPGGEPLVSSPENISDVLKEQFTITHDLEKAILKDTLSDEYLKAINA